MHVPSAVNVCVLRGSLSRPPELRTLPSGAELLTLQLTVPATGDRPAESVPVVCQPPPTAVARLQAGDEVVVTGRVRRRFFRAGGATRSVTEVVAVGVVPARQAARAARLVDEAASSLSPREVPG